MFIISEIKTLKSLTYKFIKNTSKFINAYISGIFMKKNYISKSLVNTMALLCISVSLINIWLEFS